MPPSHRVIGGTAITNAYIGEPESLSQHPRTVTTPFEGTESTPKTKKSSNRVEPAQIPLLQRPTGTFAVAVALSTPPRFQPRPHRPRHPPSRPSFLPKKFARDCIFVFRCTTLYRSSSHSAPFAHLNKRACQCHRCPRIYAVCTFSHSLMNQLATTTQPHPNQNHKPLPRRHTPAINPIPKFRLQSPPPTPPTQPNAPSLPSENLAICLTL